MLCKSINEVVLERRDNKILDDALKGYKKKMILEWRKYFASAFGML